jgi:tRNA threonylcarbamoyl adenosine modification protein YjeE
MNHNISAPLTVHLIDEEATSQFGSDLAIAISKGCIIHLRGDLGAGKSTLARAFIRQMTHEPEMEVPSPTFSLVQPYAVEHHANIAEILHADLYRLSDGNEVDELGLTGPDVSSVLLIEWPERAERYLEKADLDIELKMETGANGEEQRCAIVSGSIAYIHALRRSLKIRQFLNENWRSKIYRQPFQGDASTRSYEFVIHGNQKRILMNAPKQPDGPIIADGKPYSQIAHLAEDVTAFVGVDQILGNAGLRVPAIYGQDLEEGLLLLEDLGPEGIIDDERQPIADRYLASAAMLADFHQKDCPTQIMVGDTVQYDVPNYDREAMLIEVDLLAKWYAPRFKGAPLAKSELEGFSRIWNHLIDTLVDSEKKIVMRDFHSPNIIWRKTETDHKKVAVIDFQDAVTGPSAYDLASLAQDARVDVSPELENQIINHYCLIRSKARDFDEVHFRQDYAIMASLRATKILGIFVRLDERDHKPVYLKHLPRIQDYIKRSMGHPVLKEYKQWYEAVMEL